ncbi:DUF4288 domain-containing protein [Nocardia fluminea]|uniref:DUF4288 domain-containing protein n=1 Tax=Nocardia fluminea TaxID=134984 RepID=UPI0037199E98
MPAKQPFVGIVLYESTSDSPDYVTLYREDLVLVYEESEAAARNTMHERAKHEEGSHQNVHGETITLSFKCIVDVSPTVDADLTGGGDLYSRHFRNYEAYRRMDALLDGDPL